MLKFFGKINNDGDKLRSTFSHTHFLFFQIRQRLFGFNQITGKKWPIKIFFSFPFSYGIFREFEKLFNPFFSIYL